MDFIRPFRSANELNQIERWKLERHPLDVAAAVRERYAVEGSTALASVPGEVERLKWVGVYPQRQPGDGPPRPEADAFMMRIKIPGGRLRSDQATRIGELVERYAQGPEPHPFWGDRYCDLTTRQTIQMHWLRIEDVPQVWEGLDEVGMTSIQACGDSARNVLCCPVAGVDAEEIFDVSPIAFAISSFFTGRREYANLPRKFKISVTGCVDDCAQTEINDIGLWPAQVADGTVGFNLLVGGGLSDGPRMGSDIDCFVGLDEAVECCRAIAQLFGELGNRENRGMSRMRYLVQELGPEQFRFELAERAQFALRAAGKALTRGHRGDHIGVHRQVGHSMNYVGCSVPVGRLKGHELVEAARLAATYGDGTIRLTADQNFILSGVHDDVLDELLAAPLLSQYSPFPGPFSRGVVACTGSEFCRYAVVETKARAISWARELDARFAHAFGGPEGAKERAEDAVVRMHFSGCSASCAQPQIADIGFRGDTAHVGDQIVEAVDIGLGGSLGTGGAFVDWVFGAVPVNDVPDTLSELLVRFTDERKDHEYFHDWARRAATGGVGTGSVPELRGGADR